MTAIRPVEVRLWAKVQKGDGCWEWTGSRRNGYGRIGIRDPKPRLLSVHRLSYEMHFGPIPDGMHVCHHCDNPSCVRPDHLFLGTHSDNMRDKVAKGRDGGHRYKAGEKHRMAKLTREQVDEIRAADGPQHKIAARYGISQGHVSAIRSGVHWRDPL